MSNGSFARHKQTQDTLEYRLRQMYPTQKIETNTEYYDYDKIIGEVDVIRYINPHKVVVYEVKTGPAHLSRAKKQMKRFRDYHPLLQVKAVYMHPDHGVRRLF